MDTQWHGGLLVKSKKSWWNKFNLGERLFYQDEINIGNIILQFGTYELVWKQYLYIGNISLVWKQMNIGNVYKNLLISKNGVYHIGI